MPDGIPQQHSPAQYRPQDLVGLIIFGFFSAVLLIACWVIGRWPAFLGPEFLAGCASILVLLHVALVSRRVSAVDPVIWIPVAMLIFYFGMPFARLLGLSLPYEAWSVAPPRNLARGFAVAFLTLTSLLAGMYLHGVDDRRQPDGTPWPDSHHVWWAGLMVLAVGVAFILLGLIQTGPGVILGGYGEVYESKARGTDFRLFDVGRIFAKGGLIAMLAAHRPERPTATLFAIVAAVIMTLLFARLGDRGGLMSFAFAVAWVVSQRIRRIPASWVAVAALAAVFLLPGIKEYRTTRSVAATLRLNPIEAASTTLYEAGTSVLTFAYTLDLIPKEKSYGWGISYARAFVHLLPNIGLTPGKAFLSDVLVTSPSHWLTERIHPLKFEQGGGYGYTVGAEWYFNFGLPGVLLGMTFTGYMLCFFRERQRRSALWLAWSGLFFTMSALIVRNILGAPLKAAVWSFVGLWGLRGVTRVVAGPVAAEFRDHATDEYSDDIV